MTYEHPDGEVDQAGSPTTHPSRRSNERPESFLFFCKGLDQLPLMLNRAELIGSTRFVAPSLCSEDLEGRGGIRDPISAQDSNARPDNLDPEILETT